MLSDCMRNTRAQNNFTSHTKATAKDENDGLRNMTSPSSSPPTTYLCGHPLPEVPVSTTNNITTPSLSLVNPDFYLNSAQVPCRACTAVLGLAAGELPARMALGDAVFDRIGPGVVEAHIGKKIKEKHWTGRGVIQDQQLATKVQTTLSRDFKRPPKLDKTWLKIMQARIKAPSEYGKEIALDCGPTEGFECGNTLGEDEVAETTKDWIGTSDRLMRLLNPTDDDVDVCEAADGGDYADDSLYVRDAELRKMQYRGVIVDKISASSVETEWVGVLSEHGGK